MSQVAVPYITPFQILPAFLFLSTRCVSLEMLKAGYAIVYEGMGADYGPFGKEAFQKLEDAAK